KIDPKIAGALLIPIVAIVSYFGHSRFFFFYKREEAYDIFYTLLQSNYQVLRLRKRHMMIYRPSVLMLLGLLAG
ncbi:MAG TPA: hypothetical protein PLV15_12325, partial [Smithella sp.]|nr:hypothetical protein [Smithella sp.]